jgi:uncharacterized membrane protein
MKKIFGYFFQGLLLIAPLGLTIYILYLSFSFVDDILQTAIEGVFGTKIPGLGVIVIFLVITLLGFIGNLIVTDPITNLVERIIRKAPVIEMIYTSLKDFLAAFVGKEKRFNKPVLVKMSKNSNHEKIGFITEDDLTNFNLKDRVAVYFPFSLSFMGELFIVHQEDITPLDMSSVEMMKFVVAGGLAKVGQEEERK